MGVLFWMWAVAHIPAGLNVLQWRGVWLSIVFVVALLAPRMTRDVIATAVGGGVGVFAASVYVMYTFPSDTGHSVRSATLDAVDLVWMEVSIVPVAIISIGTAAKLLKRCF